MRKLKVLIVEDEILIAETIRLYLMEFGHIACAICISYEEAIEAFHLHAPDIILLDIRLFGEKSGIDLANYLNQQSPKPPYIFLTSQFDKRIIEPALQTLPFGYLTKPFVKETLLTSIEAAIVLYEHQQNTHPKIEIYDGKQMHVVDLREIVYLQSDHVYTKYILQNGNALLSRISFSQALENLDPNTFFRCHRSYIINLSFIAHWNKEEVGMKNGDTIPVSRSNREALSEIIKFE